MLFCPNTINFLSTHSNGSPRSVFSVYTSFREKESRLNSLAPLLWHLRIILFAPQRPSGRVQRAISNSFSLESKEAHFRRRKNKCITSSSERSNTFPLRPFEKQNFWRNPLKKKMKHLRVRIYSFLGSFFIK